MRWAPYRPVKWHCVFACRLTQTVFHIRGSSVVELFPIVSHEICHGYVSRKYRLYTMH